MKIEKRIPLPSVYKREEDFSSDLAENLVALQVGSFEDAETEAHVGTRRADIVAEGDDGILVVENQFGKADWDHWGRLEAYARLKDASIAVLVAESFEELMVVTCNLRNEDSKVDWYLIEAHVNDHKELSFHTVSRPEIDIQTEKKGVEYSEFWAPIREEGLFAGKPVPLRDESWIAKSIRGVLLLLQLRKERCYVRLQFKDADRHERRERICQLFSLDDYRYEFHDANQSVSVVFPVLDKGKDNREDWDEMREKFVSLGTEIYNKIEESDA